MSGTRDELTDIAWLKELAQEGANSPPQGGSILFAAGAIFGTASVAHWTVASGIAPFGPSAYGAIWGAAGLAFAASLVVLIARLKRKGGVETAANRAFGSVWSALGWGLFSLFTALTLLDVRQAGEADMAAGSLAIPSIIMAFYGIGWAVSATMLRRRPLWMLAVGAFAAAPVLALLAGSDEQYLAYAAALFLLMALPGFLIMRAAKA